MLENAGLSFDVVTSDVDERALVADEGLSASRAIARRLAEAKAIAVSSQRQGALVIGADQTLEHRGKTWSKPADRSETHAQLATLAGDTHKLHSAFAIASNGRLVARQLRTARLTLRQLTPDEIDAYLDTAGPVVTTSVGGYQIEGPGLRLFERIDGDTFTILGLPMLPLLQSLRRLGAIDW